MLGLAFGGASPAQGVPAVPASGPPAISAQATPASRPVSTHRKMSGLDARMQLLTAELDLNAGQQARVRQILEEQRTLTLQAWSDESVPSAVRVKATQVVAEQTAERIRAVLNDVQRERYIKPIPLEARDTPNSTDLDSYMRKITPPGK
jgi:hypothetical protein